VKCGYVKCNLGGEVSKEEGVKVGNRWYHKECDCERQLKQRCADKLMSAGMIPKLVYSFISKMIDVESVDKDYLEFTINHVVDNKMKLSNPYGIKYYMGDYRIDRLYSDHLKKEISRRADKEIAWDTAEPARFTPPPRQIPTYLKIL
jgi:hypothetical protein